MSPTEWISEDEIDERLGIAHGEHGKLLTILHERGKPLIAAEVRRPVLKRKYALSVFERLAELVQELRADANWLPQKLFTSWPHRLFDDALMEVCGGRAEIVNQSQAERIDERGNLVAHIRTDIAGQAIEIIERECGVPAGWRDFDVMLNDLRPFLPSPLSGRELHEIIGKLLKLGKVGVLEYAGVRLERYRSPCTLPTAMPLKTGSKFDVFYPPEFFEIVKKELLSNRGPVSSERVELLASDAGMAPHEDGFAEKLKLQGLHPIQIDNLASLLGTPKTYKTGKPRTVTEPLNGARLEVVERDDSRFELLARLFNRPLLPTEIIVLNHDHDPDLFEGKGAYVVPLRALIFFQE